MSRSFVCHLFYQLAICGFGRQVDLAEAVTEQLKDAEELEWSDAAAAEGTYDTVPKRCEKVTFIEDTRMI